MSAAAMIQKGVDRDPCAVALESEERDAILATLENPHSASRTYEADGTRSERPEQLTLPEIGAYSGL